MAHKDENVKSNELVQIKVPALIQILNHALRFYKLNAKIGENQCVYGFLKGSIEGTTRIVKEAEPILHHPTPDFDFNEQFIKDMDDFNSRYIEEESMDRIIGWYKSTTEPMKFKAIDVKNHLKFQNLNKLFIGMIIDPQNFLKNEGYGFSFFTLMPDSYGEINIMSGSAKIPWEIVKLGEEKDKTISFMKEMINKIIEGKKIVTELSEAFDEN